MTPQLIAQATLLLLTVAALIFVLQTVRQTRTGELSASSFPTVLLVVIVGWIATEVVSDVFGNTLREAGDWGHLGVMFTFATTMTVQLMRSRKEA